MRETREGRSRGQAQFAVLGPVQVHRRGQILSFGSLKQQLLLAVLLVERGGVVSADRLIDLLWGEHPPPSARNSLQTYVARLRRVLTDDEASGSDLLTTQGPGYALNASPEQIDAERFARLVSDAKQRAQPTETAHLLDEALALWRGPAFAGLTDCDAIRGHAVRLEELRLAAIEARVDAYLALGQYPQAVADLEVAIAAQPLRERLHEQLVRALAADGRHVQALEVVRGYRQRLAEELGLDPSPRLTALERDVLRQEPQVTPQAAPARPVARPGVVPTFTTTLFGREDERDRLVDALDTRRLVTVVGPGGVGKTRLVVEAARARDPDAANSRFCDLSAVGVDAVAHAVAAAAEVNVPPGQPVDVPAVVGGLRDRELLLVLDGCEHVLSAAASLAHAVLRQCPKVRLLATSRERLGVDGEHVQTLAPLVVPREETPPADAPAVQLFVDRARAAQPGFQLSDDNADAVAEICRRLDGLPLAIELAAARTGALRPADLATRLDERFTLLEGSRRAGDQRHRTLHQVVDWSYRLLDESQQRVFERLAVVPGGFTLDLAERLCASHDVSVSAVAGCVADLVDKSIVVAGGSDPPRYAQMETLRAYGRERLRERGETQRVAHAHAVAMTDLAEYAARMLATAEEGQWIARLDLELVNLRAAHSWARQAGDARLALRLSAALHRYGCWRLRHEVLGWAEAAVAMDTPDDEAALPAACAAAGVAAWLRGDLDAAAGHARRGLAAATDDHLAARGLLCEVVGDVALFSGRLDDALTAYADAARLAGDAGDEQTAVHNLAGGALAHAYSGRTREALDLVAAAHDRATRSSNPSAAAWVRYTRGEVLAGEDPERALTLIAEACALAASVRNEFIVGVAEVSMASLRTRLGDPVRALRGFADLITRWQRTANWTQQWTTLRNLVELLIELGADESAAVLHAATTAPETGAPSFGAEAAKLRAAAEKARQRLDSQAYQAAAERGRRLSAKDAVRTATEAIEGLLAEHGSGRDEGAPSSP